MATLAQNESNSVLRFGVNTSGTMYCQMWKNGSLQGQAITTTVLAINTWYKVILSGSNNSFKIALYEDSEVSVDPEQIENPSFPLSRIPGQYPRSGRPWSWMPLRKHRFPRLRQ